MYKKIKLFEDEKECCGCGACRDLCPKKAISMKEDKWGFLYPEINDKSCIQCGLCIKTCGYQSPFVENKKFNAYAAICKNKTLYNYSASGGVFSVMAQRVLDDGGYVVGCSLEKINNNLTAKHIVIHDKEKLYKLQGSKYVQSNMENIFIKIKRLLENGNQVLFSGTPCQASSIKRYLDKDYNNLIVLDLICHGVPNQKMFRDYLAEVGKKYKLQIESIIFRDKSAGWSLNGFIIGKRKNGKKKKIIFNSKESSYYYIFQHGLNYRRSCYNCPFAGEFRPGDITIGDYWGIEKEHPELFSNDSDIWNSGKGISCIVVNTQKGKNFLERCKNDMYLFNSTYEKIAQNNSQLIAPTIYDKSQWKELMDQYYRGGYMAVERWFKQKLGFKLIKEKIKNRTPKKAKIIWHQIIR